MYDRLFKEILISAINRDYKDKFIKYFSIDTIKYIIKNGGLHSFIGYHFNTQKDNLFINDGIKKFYGNIHKNFILNQTLHTLKKSFDKEGIRFYLLKGKVFAEKYYCHVGCRPIGDIDLFIFPNNKNKVKLLLKNAGWKLCFSDKENRIDHFTFFKKNITVEFHWEISIFTGNKDVFFIPYYILRDNIEYVIIDGIIYYTFTAEIHFIHAIFNWLKKYGWPPIKILDIYFIYNKLDRAKLFNIARKTKITKMIYFFMSMMNFYFYNDFNKIHYINEDFSLIKSFSNYRRNFFLKVLYYFTDDKLDFLYYFLRKLFPRYDFFNQYFDNDKYYKLLSKWYKEKIIQGIYHK